MDSFAVALLNWRDYEETANCAEHVLPWLTDGGGALWIVDSESDPAEATSLRARLPMASLLKRSENTGFGGGCNVALERALEEKLAWILLLNTDARVELECVQRLAGLLDGRPQAAIVGPSLWDSDQPDRLLAAGGTNVALEPATHLREPVRDRSRRTFYVPGTCAALRISAIDRVGLFDERYFLAGEMADWCARARLHGYESWIAHGAHATHNVAHRAEVRNTLHFYYSLRNRFLFVRKFHPRRRRTLQLHWSRIGWQSWVAAQRRRERLRARAARWAVSDGWRGRFGNRNALFPALGGKPT